jgi:hypothetical protein
MPKKAPLHSASAVRSSDFALPLARVFIICRLGR